MCVGLLQSKLLIVWLVEGFLPFNVSSSVKVPAAAAIPRAHPVMRAARGFNRKQRRTRDLFIYLFRFKTARVAGRLTPAQ